MPRTDLPAQANDELTPKIRQTVPAEVAGMT
jgi:hypothetical protein